MGFEALLGNSQLKENLVQSVARGRISHFYLISGPIGAGKHTLARLLAAAILCRSHGKPCLSCNVCRKVMEGNHPDFITVEDPEHKTVAVKLVRQYREDMFIRPNESEHKIYLFPQELGTEGQNALLKILEEPPSYGVFILLTDNPEKLLPTIRSRCTELALGPVSDELLQRELKRMFPEATAEDIAAAATRSGGFLGQAKELLENGGALLPQTESFAKAFASADGLELTRVLAGMEKWKRDQLIEILNQWLQLLQEALACRAGVSRVGSFARELGGCRSSQELMQAADQIKKCVEYAQGNVSPAAICGYLQWALR